MTRKWPKALDLEEVGYQVLVVGHRRTCALSWGTEKMVNRLESESWGFEFKLLKSSPQVLDVCRGFSFVFILRVLISCYISLPSVVESSS